MYILIRNTNHIYLYYIKIEKNRDLIFEAHAIDKIVPFLQQTDDLKLVQIACGALCNISMDNGKYFYYLNFIFYYENLHWRNI